jgi:hypothetical protein
MLSLFQITTGGNVMQPHCGSPIDVPAHSVILATTIELLRHNELPDPVDLSRRYPADQPMYGPTNSIQSLVAILKLLDRAQCALPLRKRALKHFRPYFSTDPWTVFGLAASLDDLQMAQKAREDIGNKFMEYKRALCPTEMSLATIRSVDVAWLAGYWRAFDRAIQSMVSHDP